MHKCVSLYRKQLARITNELILLFVLIKDDILNEDYLS